MRSKIKMLSLILIAMSSVVITPRLVFAQETKMDSKMMMPDLSGWSKSSQMAVKEMTDKYGMPTEMTATMMVWNNNGMWKKTIVSKESTKHDFPVSHMDCMEQIVSYKVPLDKAVG